MSIFYFTIAGAVAGVVAARTVEWWCSGRIGSGERKKRVHALLGRLPEIEHSDG